jgi:hypothetical protein
MSRPVKNDRRSHTPKDQPGNDNPVPRRTGAPKVSKFDGTEKLGAGKYERRTKQGKGDVVIWKDLPQ